MAAPEFDYRFTARKKYAPSGYDGALEELIDKAGRDKVFEAARKLGWFKTDPPKWVWYHIAAGIISDDKVKA